MPSLHMFHSVPSAQPRNGSSHRISRHPRGARAGLLVLLSSFLVLSAHAQDDAAAEEQTSVPPRGAWALQFGIDQHFTLRPFQGATVSAKKDVSETRAFRFGITLAAEFFNGAGDVERDYNQQQLSATAQWLFYTEEDAERVGAVRLYAGAGPQAGFSRRFNATTGPEDDGARDERTSSVWSAGLSGALGVEWTLHRRIGLLAEYESSLLFRRQWDMQTSSGFPDEENESSQTGFALEAGGVRFGVAVYL